jgi:hypothetical protein
MTQKQEVSIVRVVTAVLLIFGVFGLMVVVYAAGELSGTQKQRDRQWAQEVQRSSWRRTASSMSLLDQVEPFGILDKTDGNAATLYWPSGFPGADSPCARADYYSFGAPQWSSPESPWREAATCERVEAIVRAAHLRQLDLSGWLPEIDITTLTAYGQYFDRLHRAPLQDISAVTARAHLRIEQGDLDSAEQDARAAVSAGLHFMRGAADAWGMIWASMRVTAALDHMREIYLRRMDTAAAANVEQAMLAVKEVRSMLSRFEATLIKAAALPSAQPSVFAIASNADNPLGVRNTAAAALGFAYLANWREVLLGPSRERVQALDTLASEPVLAAAVALGRQQFDLPMKRKFSALQSTWN